MIEVYEIHAFTDRPHGGSPAGVCLHHGPLGAAAMRAIAMDLGPSVTAFVHDTPGGRLDLRWFTRMGDEVVTFCGHATFAAAHVMLRHKRPTAASLTFATISGLREVRTSGGESEMSAPRWPAAAAACPELVLRAVGAAPDAYFQGARDRLLVYEDRARLEALRPDFQTMLELGVTGVIATAPAGPQAFAFRFFCPGFRIGEDEDPATGSALSTLGPYWSERLGVASLAAVQLSERGGRFNCEVSDDAVLVRSSCATFLTGQLAFDPEAAAEAQRDGAASS